MGNQQLDSFLIINFNSYNFDSTYYARVQAIDNAFKGSNFTSPFQFYAPPLGYIIKNDTSTICGITKQLDIKIINGDSSNLSYSWSPVTSLSNSNIRNPIAKPSQTTWYKVIVTSQYGLSFIDSIKIIVQPLTINTNNITRTCGDSTTFGATVNSNSNTINYLWTPSDGLNNINILNPYVMPISTTTYYLNAVDGMCIANDTVVVTVNTANFNLDFTASPTLLNAPPFAVQFTNNTANIANYYFTWNFGDDSILNSNNPSVFHTYGYNGLYTVSLLATSIASSCPDTIVKAGYIYCVGGPNLGINEQSKDGLKFDVYPNPVSNELILVSKGNKDKVYFEIFNSIGQIVFKGNIIEKTIVQTANFSPGVYLIKLENGKIFEFKKIVKE